VTDPEAGVEYSWRQERDRKEFGMELGRGTKDGLRRQKLET